MPTWIELEDRCDDLLLPWFNLYETAFPPNERMLVSWFLGMLRDREEGIGQERHLIAAVDSPGNLVGMAAYIDLVDLQATFLWYLAVQPQERNQGIGSWLYGEILRRIPPGYRAMIFDVERPEDMQSDELRVWARRRLGFYRRQGARLLQGVATTISVGAHQPPTPMQLMIHPLADIDEQQAFELARAVYGDDARQIGPLKLD